MKYAPIPEGYEAAIVPVGWRQKAKWNNEGTLAQLRVDVIDGLLLADKRPAVEGVVVPHDAYKEIIAYLDYDIGCCDEHVPRGVNARRLRAALDAAS